MVHLSGIVGDIQQEKTTNHPHDVTKHPRRFMLGLCNSRILGFFWR